MSQFTKTAVLTSRSEKREQARTLTLELPLPPQRGNARKHWAVVHRERKAYFDACEVLLVLKRLPKPQRFAKAKITASVRVGRIHDVDNLMARMKLVADFLTRAGYITDDSPAYLEWTGLPSQTVARKNPGVTIELTEVK